MLWLLKKKKCNKSKRKIYLTLKSVFIVDGWWKWQLIFFYYFKSCVLNCDTRGKKGLEILYTMYCPRAERSFKKLHAILSARKTLNGRQHFVFLKDSTKWMQHCNIYNLISYHMCRCSKNATYYFILWSGYIIIFFALKCHLPESVVFYLFFCLIWGRRASFNYTVLGLWSTW